jgi:hypothetical protein
MPHLSVVAERTESEILTQPGSLDLQPADTFKIP